MTLIAHRDLEKAREYFHALRLQEAYHILRRYYDRLPFQPEPGHAEYIGMFVRTLYELGKKSELQFYVKELEQWYARTREVEIAYQLAYIYLDTDGPNLKLAKDLLEEILKNPKAGMLLPKAKICLAHLYDLKDDTPSCRRVIDSITEPCDFYTQNFLETWRCKLLRDEGRLDAAEAALKKFIRKVTFEVDWYAFATANILLAGVFVRKQEPQKARAILANLETLYEGKPHRSIKMQAAVVRSELDRNQKLGKLSWAREGGKTTLTYQEQSFALGSEVPIERLLAEFLRKKAIDKEAIMRAVYERGYRGGEDDALVYYQIHALRKHIRKYGLPSEAVYCEGNRYKLLPEVESRG